MKRLFMMLLVALVATFSMAGCDDNQDEGDLTAYCNRSPQLGEQDDLPSDEQLNEIEEVAPREIRDEVELVADRLREANDDPDTFEQVVDDPDVEEAFREIEGFEDEN